MKIAIFGAGSVGAYVGGALIAGGADVLLIGRARMGRRIREHGLRLSDLTGRQVALTAAQVAYAEDPAALAQAGLVLVTVKSADTLAAAQAILEFAPPAALVISLQNGVGNTELLRRHLPGRKVLAGMVPFNVLQTDDGRLHRGTAGELMVEADVALAPWLPVFAATQLPLIEQNEFLAVQWGKLLLNLNNPLNALSGLPLKAELSQRDFRRCLALLIDEALLVLQTAGIRPAKVAKVGPHMLPHLLRLPDWLFSRIAASMLRIDPEARSSMWEDLQAGRRTEVDYINGAVVRLAESAQLDAPANRRVVALMRIAETGKSVALDGAGMLAKLSG